MQWLDDHGYEAVTLDQVEAAWYEHGELPPSRSSSASTTATEPVRRSAFPVLQQLGWPGVLNLVAQGSDLPDADVKKMLDAGWELASHTITHARPDDRSTRRTLEREVAGSRQILRQRFGVPVDNFCYPSGRYDDTVISAVHRAGTWARRPRSPGSPTLPIPTSSIGSRSCSATASGFVSKLQSAREPGVAVRWRERDGVRWLEAELPGARAAFSTRLGGVSEGPFESLNLGG